MELWRQQTLVPVTWCGALVCRSGVPPIHPPDYPQRSVSDAELLELEPGLSLGQRKWSYYPTEGLLEPVQAAELMLAEAQRLGCRAEFAANALGIELDASGPDGEAVAVDTEIGTFYADCVVLAAGNFVPELLETSGSPVTIPTAEKPGKIRKRPFVRHFILKMVVLPRQAWDEHKENSKRESRVFLQGCSSTPNRYRRARSRQSWSPPRTVSTCCSAPMGRWCSAGAFAMSRILMWRPCRKRPCGAGQL